MKVLRIKESAKLPTKKDGDMCYDLYACIEKPATFVTGQVMHIPTGIKIELPQGYHASVRPRSGLAAKQGIDIMAGQIDGSYRGEWIVIITTHEAHLPVTINPGDKIAQFKIEKDETFEVVEVFSDFDLSSTDRAEKGFGSSG